MSIDMSSMSGKLTALGLMAGGTLCTVLLWNILKKCGRKAALCGKGLINWFRVAVMGLPLIWLALQQHQLITVQLPSGVFGIAAAVCFVLPLLLNIRQWGLGYGIGFTICHLVVCLIIYVAIGSLFLGLALGAAFIGCMMMSSKGGGLWISPSILGGSEFLVMPIGTNTYQDGNLGTYSLVSQSELIGPGGQLFYIIRKA